VPTKPGLKLSHYQSQALKADKSPDKTLAFPLLGLFGEGRQPSQRLSGNRDVLRGRLVAVMRMLVKAANEAGVKLEQAAEENLKKIFDRWPVKRIYPVPFDKKALAAEKLPRTLTIDVFERKVRGQVYVFQQCNGIDSRYSFRLMISA
jgi:hypothetical protein